MAVAKPTYLTMYPNTFNVSKLTLTPGQHGTYFVSGPNGEHLNFHVKDVTAVWGRKASDFGGADTAVIDVGDTASMDMLVKLEAWYLIQVQRMHGKKKQRRSAPKPCLSQFNNYRVKLSPRLNAIPCNDGDTYKSVAIKACIWSPDKPKEEGVTDSLSLTAMFLNE